MRFGSLFSGIGGLDLGMERAGFTCAWQVEADPFCQRVLQRHWPLVPRHEDVRTVRGEDLERVEVIVGGFPCQDVSQAGRRVEGIEGSRSGLWKSYHRLVCELGPRFVLVENVPGLASRGLDVVLGDLAAAGYDAEWGVLSAADVGAPHLRRRLFVLAARRPVPHAFGDCLRDLGERERQQHQEQGAGIAGDHGEGMAHGDSAGREPGALGCGVPGAPAGEPEPERRGEDVADGDRGGCEGERGTQRKPELQPRNIVDGCHLPLWPPAPDDMLAWGALPATAQPAFCGLADGLPPGLVRSRRKRLKALGNAVVPAVGEALGRRLQEIIAADASSPAPASAT